MKHSVSATQFIREFARWQIEAHKTPLRLTKRGCPSLVLLSEEDFLALSERRAPRVVRAGEATKGDLAAIRAAKPSARSKTFDHELEDPVPA